MPEGYGYPKGKDILGKVSQGELGSEVTKRPNEKLEMDLNKKITQGDLGDDSMLRLLAGLTIGIYLGINAPKYIGQCREMCDRYFAAMHDEAHKHDETPKEEPE